jgi:hypothetical protein
MFYSWCSAWSAPPQMCHPSRFFLTLHVFVVCLFQQLLIGHPYVMNLF